jgi:hypothetical protein
MSILDLSLVKAPYGKGPRGPATINGWPFRIDPTSVQLPIRAKVQKFRTIGGFVVQVYGTTWGDLTVSGQFGTGGWNAQLGFLDRMVNLARQQAIQRAPKYAGQNFSPSQPFRFTYPLLGWDFLCYLKGYTSPDGPMAVHMENQNINPKWTLTLFVVTDNGSLTTVAKTAYLQRLAPGLGVMWDTKTESYQGYTDDEYNSPLTNADVQAYVNSPTGGGAEDVVPTMPSSLTGPQGTGDANGSASAVGTTGKSVTPGNVGSIANQNDFSVALLSELGVVPGDWAVGSSQANNDVLMLNAQQSQEGQWGASGVYNAAQMHNPLNVNASSFGYGYQPLPQGTGSFPDWASGVAGTAAVYKQANFAAALQGLVQANATMWSQGLVSGGWAGAGNQGYADKVMGIYSSYGGT